ncbi:MAG: ribonuclease HII [Muribaculaceae bacterium]|nr:ribonuclease HII [Muribaculaceae bacterium]
MKPSTAVSLPTCFITGRNEAGTDEAGRGCLAGPVFAAAVILPDDFHHPLLNDSKQMTERNRDMLRPVIEAEAVAWGVGIVTAAEIDSINILRASILAMHRALDALSPVPGAVLVDGNRFFPWNGVEHRTVIKGDSKYGNIAAASVLAKTHRDEFMRKIAEEYPQYNWAVNKGYPTRDHRQAIAEHGPSPYHRLTFRLLKSRFDNKC